MLRQGIGQNGFTTDGWEGVADERPPWDATVVATWTQPSLDREKFVLGIAFSAGCLIGGVLGLVLGSPLVGAFIVLAGLWFGRDPWVQWRRRWRSVKLELRLEPDRLRLTSSLPNEPAFELSRDDADWLVAGEFDLDWHKRVIALCEGGVDNSRCTFVGAMADVRYDDPRAGSVPSRIPRRAPVAVLLASWWPHPARLLTRTGNLGFGFRWRDGTIGDFAAHERRSRLGIGGGLALVGLWLLAIGIVQPGLQPIFRAMWWVAGVPVMLAGIRRMRGRPAWIEPDPGS